MSPEDLVDITPPPQFGFQPTALLWYSLAIVAGSLVIFIIVSKVWATLSSASRRRRSEALKILRGLASSTVSEPSTAIDQLRAAMRIYLEAVTGEEIVSKTPGELKRLAEKRSDLPPLRAALEFLAELDRKLLSGGMPIWEECCREALQLCSRVESVVIKSSTIKIGAPTNAGKRAVRTK